MKREDVIRLAGAAGMRASKAQLAVNAIGRTVPVAWLQDFAALVIADQRLADIKARRVWRSNIRARKTNGGAAC